MGLYLTFTEFFYMNIQLFILFINIDLKVVSRLGVL